MADGIARVVRALGGLDFVFIVNGEEYSVNLAEAFLLSPAVSDCFEKDPTRLEFEISDTRIDHNCFKELLQFIRGETVSVAGSSRKSHVFLARHLENKTIERLFLRMQFQTASSSVTLNPRCGYNDAPLDEPIDVSSMSLEALSLLDITTLLNIFSSDELRIESEDWLMETIISLGSGYSRLLDCVQIEFLSEKGISRFTSSFGYCDVSETVWQSLVRRLGKEEDFALQARRFLFPKLFNSVIVSSLPSVLDVLGNCSYRLLYRGTRDGFQSSSLHPKVDGHSHTITLVESADGYVFGAYVTCVWDSSGVWRGDASMESFVFTLMNPHNLSPMRFSMVPP
jgi:hypothetical protein